MNKRLNEFLSLSADLTGFDRLEIMGTGVMAEYLEVLDQAVSVAVVDRLLAVHAGLSDSADRTQGLSDQILDDEQLGPLARNLLVLWYTGAWQPLTSGGPSAGQPGQESPRIVSPAAYMAGLQWRTVAAHPAGALPPGFGSWSYPPLGAFA